MPYCVTRLNQFSFLQMMKIKEVSRHYGAKIIDRPTELAKDDSPELDSWKHAN